MTTVHMLPRLCLLALLALPACADTATRTVSSMNYAQQRVDVACAQRALLDLDGFVVVAQPARDGDAVRFGARFNDDLPLSVIIRARPDNTSEVSVFTRLSPAPDPLRRRAAEYAVRAADEAIYASCTEDGQAGEAAVILDGTEQPSADPAEQRN